MFLNVEYNELSKICDRLINLLIKVKVLIFKK